LVYAVKVIQHGLAHRLLSHEPLLCAEFMNAMFYSVCIQLLYMTGPLAQGSIWSEQHVVFVQTRQTARGRCVLCLVCFVNMSWISL